MSVLHTFLVILDIPSSSDYFGKNNSILEDLSSSSEKVLGFKPNFSVAYLPNSLPLPNCQIPNSLDEVIEKEINRGKKFFFIFPAILDFSILQKEFLSQIISNARKQFPVAEFYYDEVDLSHPLLVRTFVNQANQKLSKIQLPPKKLALMLVSSGQGSGRDRAESYLLMRLIWEELGVAVGDVGFIRHENPFLADQLRKYLDKTRSEYSLFWVIVYQSLWNTNYAEYAYTICKDEFGNQTNNLKFSFLDPLVSNPIIIYWLQNRILQIWEEFRQKQSRERTLKYRSIQPSESILYTLNGLEVPFKSDNNKMLKKYVISTDAVIAKVNDQEALDLLTEFFEIKSEKVFVKVTWHGYATGTYTDPVALDKLLSSLPNQVILLESYTTSRNDGTKKINWRQECKENRDWIRQQDLLFLEKTGLAKVINKHNATYLNITELFWDGQLMPQKVIDDLLLSNNVELDYPELSKYVPRLLYENFGSDFISFARFKGPTRLSISNMFGLIPVPFKSEWHGANITDFASVCCDLVKIYGCIFNISSIVEALNYAVRWNRKGLYRSRWGNYDLISGLNMVCMSRNLGIGDALASQIQGQDIEKSAFFDVVRSNFDIPSNVFRPPIPDQIKSEFA